MQDSMNPRPAEAVDPKTKLGDEPKTAEKDSANAALGMETFGTTPQKSSYEEVYARQAKAKDKRIKSRELRQQNSIISLAHF